MDWKYVKPLISEGLIEEFEKLTGYALPDAFKTCIRMNNGGRPALRCFDTEKRKERELKSFLSFNPEDIETVWKVREWNKEELSDKYIAFAIDGFGNLICFDRATNAVVFIELETEAVEQTAVDFSAFLDALYDPDAEM